MEGFEYGSCTKRYMDTIKTYTKLSIKLVEYCNLYKVKNNFIVSYYLNFGQNIILMWAIIIAIIVAAVVLTKRLLDLFLAKFVISIKKRHDLSPLFVGAIFLPLCYQLKDMFNLSDAPKVEPFDLYYVVSLNLSCYFHYLCVPFAFLLLKDAKTEMLPRGFVNTSLIFIICLVIGIEIMGIYASIGYLEAFVFFAIGIIYYIMVFMMIPKYNKRRQDELQKWQKIDDYTRQIAEIDKEIDEAIFKDEINLKDIKKRAKETEKQHKSVLYRIMKQIWDPELELMDNCIQSPIIIASLFTTPYPKNPMMKTILRYPIVGFGIYFTMNTTFYTGFISVEIGVTILTLLAYILLEKYSTKNNVKTFIELISIVQAQSILILITNTIGDAVYFVPFSFSMNRTSVTVIWNSLRVVYPRVMYGYIFLKNNEFMVLAVSYFSCWIFQSTFMFAKNIALNVYYGNRDFDLYGKTDLFLNMPFGYGENSQKFTLFHVMMVLALWIAQMYYFNSTRGAPNKNFGKSMMIVWCVFLAFAMWFGVTQKS